MLTDILVAHTNKHSFLKLAGDTTEIAKNPESFERFLGSFDLKLPSLARK